MARNRWMTIADPIHGLIRIDKDNADHRLLMDVMNTQAFQRLRRIKQMGLAEFVFPGATHSRFVHSLGAMHLMIQVIEHFDRSYKYRKLLDSFYENSQIKLRRLLLLGILVHDIGHGPFSHSLEDILELEKLGLLHDEHWTRKILTEDAELQHVWQSYNPELPNVLLDFLGQNDRPKHFLSKLISSQMDMDRLDYLQRDSHFLGVQYGRIEADRIITCMEIGKNAKGEQVIAIREEALPAVEHYLFGRHQAYKMALHSLDKASEALLKMCLTRFRWCREHGIATGHDANELFELMTNGKNLTAKAFLRMDDNYVWHAISEWSLGAADDLLRQLATRMMTHDLPKFINLAKYGHFESFKNDLPHVYDALVSHYEARGIDFEFGFEETIVRPKALYQPARFRDPIWIEQAGSGITYLSQVSTLPLEVDPQRGRKHLLFMWDKEARRFLQNTLDNMIPYQPEAPA